MKHLRILGLAFSLMCVLAVNAFGDQPCAPGEILTPPCAAQSETDPGQIPTVPGETPTGPASAAVDVTDITEAVLWALSLF